MPVHDLVLSSGFLAFAAHCGFLEAIEDDGVVVDGVCGTSSGAMVGALWAAGWPARRILDELGARAPIRWMRLSRAPWRGVFSMGSVIDHLGGLLPDRIEDLPRPFGVGVIDPDGAPRILTRGPLAAAVAASCAMPFVFTPVSLDSADGPIGAYSDGGARDRVGLAGWRRLRGARPTLVHLVRRSAGPESGPMPGDVRVVHSERSRATFLSLGDLRGRAEATREATAAVCSELD